MSGLYCVACNCNALDSMNFIYIFLPFCMIFTFVFVFVFVLVDIMEAMPGDQKLFVTPVDIPYFSTSLQVSLVVDEAVGILCIINYKL